MRILIITLLIVSSQICWADEMELHHFIDDKGEVLGIAYADYFDGKIFKQFWIERNGTAVFRIVDEQVIGPHGIETEVSKENLYGYKVVLAQPEYMVLVMASPEGRGVSDALTIGWIAEKQEFHLMKAP